MKSLAALSLIIIMFTATSGFGADVCAKYYGKGYCVDYIKLKAGKKQSGNAENWYSNISKSKVKAGDVAIFSYGHVAYVDSVNKDKKKNVVSVNISEWNYGSKYTDKYCRVTNMYGKKGKRTLALSSVTRFWRP